MAADKIRLVEDEAEEYLPAWPGGVKPVCRQKFEDVERSFRDLVAEEKRRLVRSTRKTVLAFSLAAMLAIGLVNGGLAWYLASKISGDFRDSCHSASGVVVKTGDLPACLVPAPAPALP